MFEKQISHRKYVPKGGKSTYVSNGKNNRTNVKKQQRKKECEKTQEIYHFVGKASEITY